jgi:hypothetical protein
MRGATSSIPNTPSWRAAQLKKGIGTTLPFKLTALDSHSINSNVIK